MLIDNQPILACHSLDVGYSTKRDGKICIISDINFVVGIGQMVSLVGPSGVGKSTLLDTLGLMKRELAGDLLIFGKRVSTLSKKQRVEIRRRSIGYVFQSFNLVNHLSAVDNVTIGLPEGDLGNLELEEKVRGQLRSVGILGPDQDKLPASLSVGQRQRIGAIRALLKEPSIIFADEPSGNLDQTNTDILFELFHAYVDRGGTVIYVTHSEKLAEMGNRVYEVVPNGEGPSQFREKAR